MKTIDTLDNDVFKHLITTIGALPTSFIDSMSYYEMIAWLVDYIKTQVVPAVNNNAEAVKEIQKWIENLDLQDEVDTKLEEMAESGELATIIAQIVDLGTVFGYNTIAAMAAAENLTNGSICRVLGNTNYTNGDGAFYKVRALLNTDVIDGVNKVTLTNTDNLIAVRIPDAGLNATNAKLKTVTNNSSNFAQKIINQTVQTVLFAGDSLTYGLDPATDLQSAHPFPLILQTFVRDWFADNTLLTCLNYGVSGVKSSYGLSHFNDYLAQHPTTIFWEYGTNDITAGDPIADIVDNLDQFYQKCIDNNIELIVLISPSNYGNLARQTGMRLLREELISYCENRGIQYVDVYKYVKNIYESLTIPHLDLQTDNVHFADYTCFSDAILSSLLPVVYNQKSSDFNYINISNTRDYVKTNITSVDPANTVTSFGDGLMATSDTGNTFVMNFYCDRQSILYMQGFCRSSCGQAVFTLDGVDYTVDEYLATSNDGDDPKNIYNFKIANVGAGLHTITLKSITLSGGATRFYMWGFTLKNNPASKAVTGYRMFDKKILLWSGSSSAETATNLDIDVKKFNKLVLTVGAASSAQTIDLCDSMPYRKFSTNYTWKFPTTYNGTMGIATFALDVTNNQFTYSTTQTAPLRRVYGCVDNNWFEDESYNVIQ